MKVDGIGIQEPSQEEVENAASRAARHLTNVAFSRSSGEDYTGVIDLFTNNLRR
jgi:hypothetical protein